jgi:hypothetical protein
MEEGRRTVPPVTRAARVWSWGPLGMAQYLMVGVKTGEPG